MLSDLCVLYLARDVRFLQREALRTEVEDYHYEVVNAHTHYDPRCVQLDREGPPHHRDRFLEAYHGFGIGVWQE